MTVTDNDYLCIQTEALKAAVTPDGPFDLSHRHRGGGEKRLSVLSAPNKPAAAFQVPLPARPLHLDPLTFPRNEPTICFGFHNGDLGSAEFTK